MLHHARAKLNLTLRVGRRRLDGYHEVESLVAFAGLADRLEILPDGDLSLRLSGPFAAGISAGTGNSVVRAARLFAETRNIPSGWSILLEKNIPPAAGLGGGSSDAAAVLAALAGLHGGMAHAEQQTLASSLGADVPVCLHGRASMMRGRGDRIQPVATPLPETHLLLAKPLGMLSAGEVYLRRDETAGREGRDAGGNPPGDMDLPALISWCRKRPNDLELPAISLLPEIRTVLSALEESGDCLLARMSGSGPVCFGVYETFANALRSKEILAARHPDWWLRVDALGDAASKKSEMA